MDTIISKQTLFGHFSGQSTPIQQKAISDWLEHPESLELYFLWLEEWERLNPQFQADEREAFAQLWQQVQAFEEQQTTQVVDPPVIPLSSPVRSVRWTWLVAASVALALIGLTAYLNRSFILYRTIATQFGEVRTDTLPDGSVVTLNANSSLRYPRFGFGNRTREVFLTGEGAFSVQHTQSNQRFVVKTGKGFDVIVLGTEFTVFARQRGAKVVLNRGKVEIDYHRSGKSQQLTMQPGDVVALDKQGSIQKTYTKRPELQAAWQQHRYVFEETSLLEIATLLEENYGLNVTIRDEALANRTISGTYQATNADQLLETVTQLLEINYNRQNDTVLLFE
ncbi:DUF4974 domain-containing protein [Rudanella paleaurantiibacter]|uniref:DUF4974 domain-containing protein n=1 Tax=Rudanella paleaurantiibacter TaxID=2614655 RepID=A0A7J5TVC8_9BACT|nr:FecR domain-containing protein [Rudanella paleaurantiibacter]KAB7726868.1 DUF4974 domain-containing protein [Rudanella paleaurantiibacter]